MLINGGFEDGFRYVDGIPQLYVAEGWEPWWDPRATRPEYKDAQAGLDARRVRSGMHAQQWFNSFATHTAGIRQRIEELPRSGTLHFEAWAQCWSANWDDAEHSDGRYRMRIGIDPYGGLDPESEDVVWSNGGNAIQPYDEYQHLEVSCPIMSDRATLFVWGQAEWALKHNDAYVDDCRVWIEGAPAPGPPGDGGERVDALIGALIAFTDGIADAAIALRSALAGMQDQGRP